MALNWLIIIVLSVFGGIGKAVRNTVENHFEQSIFDKIKSAAWRKWFRSWGEDSTNHLR